MPASLPWVRLLALLLAVVWSVGCNSEPGVLSPEGDPTEIPRVTVLHPREAAFAETVSATGSLLAYEQAQVSMKVAGRIQSFHVDLGSCLQQGEVIASLEPEELQLRVDQAAAALAQAEARLGVEPGSDLASVKTNETATVRQAQAVLDEARLRLERVRQLFEEGIISKADLDIATSEYRVAEARHQEAVEEVHNRLALVAQRRSELAIARQNLTDARIRAPFAGCIQQRIANVGEYLGEGSPVAALVRMDPLRLRLQISERDASAVRPGQAITFNLEGDPNTYSAKVQRVSPAIAEQGRVVIVEADTKHQPGLRPGSFVRAQIVTNPESPALAVPQKSVVTFAGIQKVLVVTDGKVAEREVRTGRRSGPLVEIVSGLSPQDAVVANPEGVRVGEAVQAGS